MIDDSDHSGGYTGDNNSDDDGDDADGSHSC